MKQKMGDGKEDPGKQRQGRVRGLMKVFRVLSPAIFARRIQGSITRRLIENITTVFVQVSLTSG